MLARSVGISYIHYINGGCCLLKWILSFQGEECRWSAHHDEEEIKPIYIHIEIMNPGCSLFCLELSLATRQQPNDSSKN